MKIHQSTMELSFKRFDDNSDVHDFAKSLRAHLYIVGVKTDTETVTLFIKPYPLAYLQDIKTFCAKRRNREFEHKRANPQPKQRSE